MAFRNLILTGFMGSGKSTIGKALAEKLSLSFIETDDEVIKLSGFSSIKDIISIKDEPFFRELEKKVLIEILKNSNQVISLGGGTICEPEIKNLFDANDTIIYLEVPFSECLERIKLQELDPKTPKRPLFKDEKSALELYNKRESIYKSSSSRTITSNNKTVDEILNQLCEMI